MSPVLGGSSIQLARINGIRIGVAPSWFFVLFLIIWTLSGQYSDQFDGDSTKGFVLAVVSALLFFVSVLLHELGHATVALRNGIGIRGIDLWMFGGVAMMDRESESPGVEFRVSAAGPAVTAVIAAVCFGVLMLVAGPGDALDSTRFNAVTGNEVIAVLGFLAFVNASLLVFNLIPGYPLDGGRIARSIIWWRTGDRTRSTRIAARLGRGVSYLMVLAGVYVLFKGDLVSGIWFAFIGLFLGQAARQTEMQTRVTGQIEGVYVRDVMDAEPVAIPQDTDLARAFDDYFLRYGFPWFPVIDGEGSLTGLVVRESIESIPEAARAGRTVASVIVRDEDSGEGRLRVGIDEPLEALLSLEALQRLGAILAVDGDGRLRGIVTVQEVRHALSPAGS